MKKLSLFLSFALMLLVMSGCNKADVGTIDGADYPTDIAISDNEDDYGRLELLRIVDGAETGKLILAGNSAGDIYFLDVTDKPIVIDGKNAKAEDLQDGMPIDVYHDRGFEHMSMPYSHVIDITSFCKGVVGYSIGTEKNPGGTYYDLCGLYLKVLEDLWQTDDGLNGGIEYISVDLSKAPGELTEGEKSAVAYIFAKAHDKICLQLSYEELAESGYINKDELYWKDGIIFSISNSQKAEEQHFGLKVIKFNAEKWRSGTGAYFFNDCTASWPQNGTWTDYTIGVHAIS